MGIALRQLLALAEGGNADARGGLATALRTVAPLLAEEQVAVALDFLLSEGLADHDPNVREQMVIAGLSSVAHLVSAAPCSKRSGLLLETPTAILEGTHILSEHPHSTPLRKHFLYIHLYIDINPFIVDEHSKQI